MQSTRSSFSGRQVSIPGTRPSHRVSGGRVGRGGRVSRLVVQDGFILTPTGDGDTAHLDNRSFPVVPTIVLRPGNFRVGRDAPADIVIPIPTISGSHADVTIGERVSITDLGSTNGTYVDGQEITPGETELLPLGSEIIFGDMHLAKFILDYEEEEAAAEPETPTVVVEATVVEPEASPKAAE